MAFARNWRHPWVAETPERASTVEIPSLNAVFSEAFTERYRKDGMVGVRVPHLNPAVWKFAITDAEDGAMIWRNARDGIAAFNMVHRSGVEGWMGPLAVHPDYQGTGIGKMIVTSGVDWLKKNGAKVIGLETMPRTMDNVGFYSTLGFSPGHLTVTVTLETARAGIQATAMSTLNPHERELALRQCKSTLASLHRAMTTRARLFSPSSTSSVTRCSFDGKTRSYHSPSATWLLWLKAGRRKKCAS